MREYITCQTNKIKISKILGKENKYLNRLYNVK